MKGGGTKLILLLHPFLHKPPSAAAFHHRLGLAAVLSLLSLTLLVTFLHSSHPLTAGLPTTTVAGAGDRLPASISDALLHYAAATNATDRMSADELHPIATTLRRRPSNLLIFGLTAETLLWKALNAGGRTIFLDEKEHLISKLESSVAGFEGYDVRYATKAADFKPLIHSAVSRRKTECKPVQNLLFSDCTLALNDLPNHIYSIDWDVILIDGPSGYSPDSPGRTSAIFTAGVLARRKGVGVGGRRTDVFVHDFGREAERASSEAFLCMENLVEVKGNLGHFVLPEMDAGSSEFCSAGAKM